MLITRKSDFQEYSKHKILIRLSAVLNLIQCNSTGEWYKYISSTCTCLLDYLLNSIQYNSTGDLGIDIHTSVVSVPVEYTYMFMDLKCLTRFSNSNSNRNHTLVLLTVSDILYSNVVLYHTLSPYRYQNQYPHAVLFH